MKKTTEEKILFDILMDIEEELELIGFTKEKQAKINRYQERLEKVGEKAHKTERFTGDIVQEALSIYVEILKDDLGVNVEHTAKHLKTSLTDNLIKLSLLFEKFENQEQHSLEDLEIYVKLNRLIMADTKILCSTLVADLQKYIYQMWQLAIELKFKRIKAGIENEK